MSLLPYNDVTNDEGSSAALTTEQNLQLLYKFNKMMNFLSCRPYHLPTSLNSSSPGPNNCRDREGACTSATTFHKPPRHVCHHLCRLLLLPFRSFDTCRHVGVHLVFAPRYHYRSLFSVLLQCDCLGLGFFCGHFSSVTGQTPCERRSLWLSHWLRTSLCHDNIVASARSVEEMAFCAILVLHWWIIMFCGN